MASKSKNGHPTKASARANARLGKEIKIFMAEMPPGVLDFHVDESNMKTILFLLEGPPGTTFEGGVYVLKMQLPSAYPFSAPDFLMMTPNGRFATNTRVCTSFSSFHPETWSPSYTLTTLVLSFISFMAEETSVASGAVNTPPAERRRLAKESLAWNIRQNYHQQLPKLKELQVASKAACKQSVGPSAGTSVAKVGASAKQNKPVTLKTAAPRIDKSAHPCTTLPSVPGRAARIGSCVEVMTAMAAGPALPDKLAVQGYQQQLLAQKHVRSTDAAGAQAPKKLKPSTGPIDLAGCSVASTAVTAQRLAVDEVIDLT